MTRELSKIQQDGSKPILLRKQSSILQTRMISLQNELEQMTGEVKQCEARIRGLAPQVEQAANEAEANKKIAIAKSDNITEPPDEVLNGNLNTSDIDKEINQANVQVCKIVRLSLLSVR